MEHLAHDTGSTTPSPLPADTSDCLRTALARALEQIAQLEHENQSLRQAANHVAWLTSQ